MRGSRNSSDDDDSEDIIEEEEEYSSDDSSTESIDENENNQTNNTETESNNDTNNQENTDNKNENQRVLTPIPPSSASSSPRTSINRLRTDNTQAHESANQNSSDESESQSQKLRPIIINPRLSRITRPNIQSNQRKITIPRNRQPKKSGKWLYIKISMILESLAFAINRIIIYYFKFAFRYRNNYSISILKRFMNILNM